MIVRVVITCGVAAAMMVRALIPASITISPAAYVEILVHYPAATFIGIRSGHTPSQAALVVTATFGAAAAAMRVIPTTVLTQCHAA